MIKKMFIFCMVFFASFVYAESQEDVFGVWNISFRDSEGFHKFEVEFDEEIVTFYYPDSNSVDYFYYFEEESGISFMFIGTLGYYYERIDENNFTLIPAFGSDLALIRFQR